jgi:hypothetical protein
MSAFANNLIAPSDRTPVVFAVKSSQQDSYRHTLSKNGFAGLANFLYALARDASAPRRYEVSDEIEFEALCERLMIDPKKSEHASKLIVKAAKILKMGGGLVLIRNWVGGEFEEVFAPSEAPTYEDILIGYLTDGASRVSISKIIIRSRDEALQYLGRQDVASLIGLNKETRDSYRKHLGKKVVDLDTQEILKGCLTIGFLTPADLAAHRERVAAAVEPKNEMSP